MESKKFNKMLVVGVMVIILSCFSWSGKANGQEKKYPSKPIDVIIHFAAGGPTDIWTRIVANDLSNELGASLSIQYKPGAGGMIGASYVATQKPDGYTLLSGSFSSLVSAPFLEKEAAPYDVLKDFTPIAAYVVAPNVLLSHTSSNLTSLEAVVKLAKEKPGQLTCASAGVGTTAHLVIEVFRMYGVNLTHVPAKGGGPAATTLLGKHVDLASIMYNAAVPHIKSGAFRILAATDKMAQEPGVATLKEKGFPECEGLGSFQGFLGPPNLPKPIQDQLANSIRKVSQIPSVKKGLEDAGFTVVYLGPDELKKMMADDYRNIEKIAKAAGLGKYAK